MQPNPPLPQQPAEGGGKPQGPPANPNGSPCDPRGDPPGWTAHPRDPRDWVGVLGLRGRGLLGLGYPGVFKLTGLVGSVCGITPRAPLVFPERPPLLGDRRVPEWSCHHQIVMTMASAVNRGNRPPTPSSDKAWQESMPRQEWSRGRLLYSHQPTRLRCQ